MPRQPSTTSPILEMKTALQTFTKLLETRPEKPDLDVAIDLVRQANPSLAEWDEMAHILADSYGVGLLHVKERAGLALPQRDFIQLLHRLDIKGWLYDVVIHCEGMESPASFNFASALVCVAAILRRRIWIDQGFFKIWPATQALLVARIGMRKTVGADHMVDNIAIPVQSQLPEGKSFNLLPDEGSSEALKKHLAKLTNREGEATGLLRVGEFATYLGKQDYMASLVQSLTDLFDSRAYKNRETIARGEEVMRNIGISAILASNEGLLAGAVPPIALGSGLFSRILCFHEEWCDKVIPLPEKPPQERVDDLIARYAQMAYIKGEAKLTPKAKRLFTKIYHGYKTLLRHLEDERMSGWIFRADSHLLRIAMLLSVAESPDPNNPPTIDEKHIHQAEGIIKWITDGLPELYSYLGNSPHGEERKAIMQALKRRNGMVTDTKLGRILGHLMPRAKLEAHLQDLVRSGIVEVVDKDPWEGKKAWRLARQGGAKR